MENQSLRWTGAIPSGHVTQLGRVPLGCAGFREPNVTTRKKSSATSVTRSNAGRDVDVGESVKMAIDRLPTFNYLTVDKAVAAGPITGTLMELSLFALVNRFSHQNYKIVIDEDGDKAMQSESFEGAATLVEQATIRMTSETAMDVATVILRHCLSKGLVSPDEVAGRLIREGLTG